MNLRKRLRGSGWRSGVFSLRDFEQSPSELSGLAALTDGGGGPTVLNVPDQRTVALTLQADRPVALRDDKDAELQLVLPAYYQTTTDGSGNTQTFEPIYGIADCPSTEDIVLYAGEERVEPDAVDHEAGTFDYTDDGSEQELQAFIVPREPAEVELRKVVSDGRVSIKQTLWQQNTAISNTRDQTQQPLQFDVSASDMERYIPRKSHLQVVVKASYPVAIEGAPAGGPELPTIPKARNAVLSVPKFQTESRVEGLLAAVKEDAANIGSAG